MTYETREQWLHALAVQLRPTFKRIEAPLPKNIRMACGFTSHGSKSAAIGQCWAESASRDGSYEIMISPILDEPLRVADVLAHELAHAAVGIENGHNRVFGRVARELGLDGKLTATIAGDGFRALVGPMLSTLGPYPHAQLMPLDLLRGGRPGDTPGKGAGAPRTSGPKKQGTRLKKVTCNDCGYTARVTRTWLDKQGAPLCPCNVKPMAIEGGKP